MVNENQELPPRNNLSRLSNFFIGDKTGQGEISSRHQDFLEKNGFKPVEVLRYADFHDLIVRTLAGADVVHCRDNNEADWVMHLTDGKAAGHVLLHEAKISRQVSGLNFQADNGWSVKFPEKVITIKDNRTTATAYPFYEGAGGREFTKEFGDQELTEIGLAVLMSMEKLMGSLGEKQKAVLRENSTFLENSLSIAQKITAPALRIRRLLDPQEAAGLVALVKKGNRQEQALPVRLIHHDLHTFNVIPNQKEKTITLVDLSLLTLGKSLQDYGRWLTFLLISDRETAMRQLENELLDRKMITQDLLVGAKAGGLLGWGRELSNQPENGKRAELEIGKKLWKKEVKLLLSQN